MGHNLIVKLHDLLTYVLFCRRDPGIWNRLLSLEARASLRQTLFTIIYLPIVYTVFGLVLGESD